MCDKRRRTVALLLQAEEELRQLIRMCWAQKPAERPSFEEIVARVHDISSAMPEETSYDHTYDHT